MKEYKIIEKNIEYTVIIYDDGDKFWLFNSKLHREDGPAIEYANGYKLWYYQGKEYKVNNNEEFLRLMKIKAFL